MAQKYLAARPVPKSESVAFKTLINRVVDTVVRQGNKGYFTSDEPAETHREELKYVLTTPNGGL